MHWSVLDSIIIMIKRWLTGLYNIIKEHGILQSNTSKTDSSFPRRDYSLSSNSSETTTKKRKWTMNMNKCTHVHLAFISVTNYQLFHGQSLWLRAYQEGNEWGRLQIRQVFLHNGVLPPRHAGEKKSHFKLKSLPPLPPEKHTYPDKNETWLWNKSS